jgi:arylsulfatase A-like enzyme
LGRTLVSARFVSQKSRLHFATVGLLCLLLFGGGCTAETGAAARRPDLILILLDTVRRDHIGSYGYHRDTTPVIDSLARDGLVFERAVAQSSWTLPSFGSLMTSRYPREIFPETEGVSVPVGNVYTFAQALRNGGYRTISVTTNPYNHEIFRLMQGVEHPNHLGVVPADAVVTRAIEQVDRAIGGGAERDDAPYFLFLHFMDNHFPLGVPPPFDTHFPALDDRPHDAAMRNSLGFGVPEQAQGEDFEIYRSHMLSLYDGSLYLADHQLGRLFEHLRERRVFENAVIVVASDHGQAFWDHGREEKELGLEHFQRRGVFGLGHGHTLFPELIRVPLIVSGRGVPSGRVQSQVRNLDIAPTLLSIAGIDDPGFEGRGVPLLEGLADGTLGDLPAYSETATRSAAQWTVWDGSHRYLRVGERELLFGDEMSDLRDLAANDPDTLARLRRELDEVLRFAVPPAAVRDKDLPEETLDHLRKLGYVD